MRWAKRILIALAAFLIGREAIGLFQWFVIEGKSWSDFKELDIADIEMELHDELEFYRRPFRRLR